MVGILLSSKMYTATVGHFTFQNCQRASSQVIPHVRTFICKVTLPFLPGQAICTYLTTLVCKLSFINLLQRGMKTGLHLAVRNTASDKINKARGNTQSYTNVM